MRPWGDGPRACPCGAAADPCPICNKVQEDDIPELPAGFVSDVKRSWPWWWG
jgi:hypothetical protein